MEDEAAAAAVNAGVQPSKQGQKNLKLMMALMGRSEMRAGCTDASPALRHGTEIKEI